MSAEDERALLKRLRERDERAFRDLITSHRDRVYNITFRMLGNKSEAEDVAQEVFITVFKSIDTFREDSKLSTWLYRVAVNHCKNRLKYLKRRHERDRDELDEGKHDDSGSNGAIGSAKPRSPDAALAGMQIEEVLRDAINQLDDEQRLVVILRDVEDLSI